MRTILILAVGLAISGSAFAQNTDTQAKEEALAAAKARVVQLTQDLGLTEEQVKKATEAMVNAEVQVMPEREKCKAIETHVEQVYNAGYDEVVGVLTPEQAAKLAEMRKSGKVNTSCCTSDEAKKAGCEKGAAKAGCCAGKAGASHHGASGASGATAQPSLAQ